MSRAELVNKCRSYLRLRYNAPENDVEDLADLLSYTRAEAIEDAARAIRSWSDDVYSGDDAERASSAWVQKLRVLAADAAHYHGWRRCIVACDVFGDSSEPGGKHG